MEVNQLNGPQLILRRNNRKRGIVPNSAALETKSMLLNKIPLHSSKFLVHQMSILIPKRTHLLGRHPVDTYFILLCFGMMVLCIL